MDRMLFCSGRIVWLALAAVASLVGCHHAVREPAKTLLSPARMSPDSCVLEVFFVRFPFGDPEINRTLWQQVDEQHFCSSLRQDLACNGFRVGVLSGRLPPELSELMALSDKPPPQEDLEAVPLESLEGEPSCVRRHLQLRTGTRSEILASGTHDLLPVLMRRGGELCGQTYRKAQAVFGVCAFAEPSGEVRLELMPEVHHDEARQRWIGDQGVLRLETSRPRRVFEELAISAELAPGDLLLVGSLPNRRGSLGHHFFSEDEGCPQQKLLIVRLSQTQHDPLFSPPLDLDAVP